VPYLALNGVTIPTAKGGVIDVAKIGESRRAFDGTLIRERRAVKRKWSFQTKPITELRALSIVGLLQGKGFYLPFDGDLYAKNGYGYTGSISQVASTAADGALVYDENGAPQTKSGIGAVSADGAQVNMLSASMSQPSATTGFSMTGGGSFALNATHRFAGSNSIAVTTAAAISSGIVNSTPVAGVLNASYTASAYIKSPNNVRFILWDFANNVLSDMSVVPVSGTTWKRAVATITTPAAGSTPQLGVYAVTPTAVSFTFYIGGLQLEQTLTTNSWIIGGASRTATSLQYPANPCGPQGCTINWWQTPPVSSPRYAFSAWEGAGNQQIAIYAPSTTELNCRVKVGSYDVTKQAFGLTYIAGWNMMTVVFRSQPKTGEYNWMAYQNGVLKGYDSLDAMPLSSLVAFYVGSNLGANPSRTRLDEFQVLPYPVDSNTITGWYSGGGSVGATPYISASGDALHDTSVNVVGQVSRVETVSFADANGWQQGGRVVSFTLEEV